MAKKQEMKTDDIVTSQGVKVVVGDHHFLLRRLPGNAIFKISSLFKEIFIRGLPYIEITGGLSKNLGEAEMGTILMMGLPHAEYEVMEFLSYITEIPVEDFGNPDKVPLKAISKIILALNEHPDINDFLEDAETLRSAIVGGWIKAISLVFPEYQQVAQQQA